MKMHHRVLLRMGVIALFGCTLSACTIVTDPTESSSDFTSSTSGKSSSGKAMNQQGKISIFAAANFDRLKEDMAKGRGEHLTSFAMLLGVPKERRAEFYIFTQEKFPVMFPSEQVTADEMVATLTRELSGHPQLHSLVAMNSSHVETEAEPSAP